ncbi:MAG: tetratricopeptide repeat protein, partial [Cyanobacteria bacterium P01_G01_bin.49]
MTLVTSFKLNSENNRTYQKLLSVIEASENTLSLLIAVCDDRYLRDKIIEAYETELLPNIQSYQICIDQDEPSLKAAINKIIQSENFINCKKNAVLTVIGAEDLLFIHRNGEKSQQDKLFGYLQWTREGLREFHYAIILWITDQILVNLSQKAPDFWSWRKGVFHFVPEPSLMTVSLPNKQFIFNHYLKETVSESLLLEDLQELIINTEEKRGKKDPNLVTLYNRLGDFYLNRIKKGEVKNYPDEKEKTLRCYYQALEIAEDIGKKQGQATSYLNLGKVYDYCEKFQQAIDYYNNSLAIFKDIGDLQYQAITYINLGAAYYFLGQYQETIKCYQQSLAIFKNIGNIGFQANCHNVLGTVYDSLGQYQKAIQYYQQSLIISTKIDDKETEANSYAGLGFVYFNLKQYQSAIEYYQQSLSISIETSNIQREATIY